MSSKRFSIGDIVLVALDSGAEQGKSWIGRTVKIQDTMDLPYDYWVIDVSTGEEACFDDWELTETEDDSGASGKYVVTKG